MMVNGVRVDVPSLRVKEGDVITVRPASIKTQYFAHLDDIMKETNQPTFSWMKSDPKKLTITITGLPKREEAEADINEQLIVEYYSR
jgi:small subunit ribosomal protein S4